ncbi:MAG: 16S rRNA (uracil(1498)-N(3))-methyltransferase [Xanthomonadales bacterium]|nr:16S rRNA (uracil(1498)-N(3))-methyltransferase [Xanthomonadales bacterium]
MRHSRIHTPQALTTEAVVKLEDPASHYITRVLRLSIGDSITLFNGDGCDYTAEICELQRQNVMLRVSDSLLPENESPLKITLVQAISRGERMDFSLQKATELGVHCIQPVISRRVEVRLNEKRQIKRVAHWQAVVISACEQSGRALVPEVRMPVSLLEWASWKDESPRLVLDPTATQKMSSMVTEGELLSLLIGPEGGFSTSEMKTLEAQGVKAVTLGRRILRTETAGPAAIAILQATLGDL